MLKIRQESDEYGIAYLKHWRQHPVALDVSAFKWATSKQAFAGHVAKRSVVMKPLEYNADGTIKPVDNTPSLVKH